MRARNETMINAEEWLGEQQNKINLDAIKYALLSTFGLWLGVNILIGLYAYFIPRGLPDDYYYF